MPHMAMLLQFCAYALRAKWMLGRAGDQSGRAKSHRSQFYEDVWREAAGELGATFEVLGNEIFAISRSGASTRVHNNYTTLDDPITLRVALENLLCTRFFARTACQLPIMLSFR